MKNEYRFRLAEQRDLPALIALRLAYFEEEFGTLSSEQLDAIRNQLPRYFAEHLGVDCFAFVAETAAGEIVANTILCCEEKPANPFFPNGKSGTVLGVYTMPDHRRKGIAAALMQRLMKQARRQSLDVVRLTASAMGRSVYAGIGFQEKIQQDTPMEFSLWQER